MGKKICLFNYCQLFRNNKKRKLGRRGPNPNPNSKSKKSSNRRMNPEIARLVEETVVDILRRRNGNLENMTKYNKVRVAASKRLQIDLSGKEYRNLVRRLVDKYKLGEEGTKGEEETKEVVSLVEGPTHEAKGNGVGVGDGFICELSNNTGVMVEDFEGEIFVSMREFYVKDGKRIPSSEGISMTAELWSGIRNNMPAIDQAIREMGSDTISSLPPPSEVIPVEIVRLDGNNYQCWEQHMQLLLKQLKIEYVLTEPCPRVELGTEASIEEITPLKAAQQKWMDDDYKCRCNILNSLSDDLLHRHPKKKAKTAKALWEELKSEYELHIFQRYFEFQMEDGKSVVDQVYKFNRLANKVTASGIVINKKYHVLYIIQKLPSSWNDFRAKLMREEYLPLWKLLHLLKAEEQFRTQVIIHNGLGAEKLHTENGCIPQIFY